MPNQRAPDEGVRLDAIGKQVVELRHELETARREWAAASAELRELLCRSNALIAESDERNTTELARVLAILQLVYDREPEFRERVRALRTSDNYERAFSDPEPLVSVIIPTYQGAELLVERSVASALRQTYPNVEVVVVGDTSPPETELLLSKLGDPRVRYHNLVVRGPYPRKPRDLWHVAGIPPRNEAVALALGSWIAPLDDDDAFTEDHVERLLELARAERAEVVYGLMRCLMNDGRTFHLGQFPPALGQFGWQAALFHGGLRFFEMELADALFFSPGDWSLCRRMLRAGVRFAMLDRVVVDHYESRYSPNYARGDSGR